MIEKFEDLNVWKESMKLDENMYSELRTIKHYVLRDQIQRASVLISSNIAEGFERESNKEFIRFLFISKASCGELMTQNYLANTLNIIDRKAGENLLDQNRKVSATLYKLIKTRKEKF